MYLFGFFGSKCFETFELSDSIDDKLGSNTVNLIKPNLINSGQGYGWPALVLFGMSIVLYKIFGCYPYPWYGSDAFEASNSQA